MQTGYDAKLLKANLTIEEGRRNMMYKDSKGINTCYIGHNMDIRQSEFVIDAVYNCDIAGCEASLDLNLPWWRGEDPVRQVALMDLMFNMGWGTLSTFVNTLAAWKAHKYGAAAQGLRTSKWAKQVQISRVNRIIAMVEKGIVP